MGKGEIACNEQFLLFPQCFLPLWRTFSLLSSKFKLSSAKYFNLEESTTCCLGKGIREKCTCSGPESSAGNLQSSLHTKLLIFGATNLNLDSEEPFSCHTDSGHCNRVHSSCHAVFTLSKWESNHCLRGYVKGPIRAGTGD